MITSAQDLTPDCAVVLVSRPSLLTNMSNGRSKHISLPAFTGTSSFDSWATRNLRRQKIWREHVSIYLHPKPCKEQSTRHHHYLSRLDSETWWQDMDILQISKAYWTGKKSQGYSSPGNRSLHWIQSGITSPSNTLVIWRRMNTYKKQHGVRVNWLVSSWSAYWMKKYSLQNIWNWDNVSDWKLPCEIKASISFKKHILSRAIGCLL